MDVIVERSASLDVHKDQVTACVRYPVPDGGRAYEICEAKTTVGGLLVLLDWLRARCHAGGDAGDRRRLEAVWAILEDDFDCLLVNARQGRHVQDLTGRKTDVNDAELALPAAGGDAAPGARPVPGLADKAG